VESHEWLEVNGNVATVGISDYAQKALGEIVYVDLPAVGDQKEQRGQRNACCWPLSPFGGPAHCYLAAEEAGAVESVKAASAIYAPVDGAITEVRHCP
jgi:glycine cleavage system H protein